MPLRLVTDGAGHAYALGRSHTSATRTSVQVAARDGCSASAPHPVAPTPDSLSGWHKLTGSVIAWCHYDIALSRVSRRGSVPARAIICDLIRDAERRSDVRAGLNVDRPAHEKDCRWVRNNVATGSVGGPPQRAVSASTSRNSKRQRDARRPVRRPRLTTTNARVPSSRWHSPRPTSVRARHSVVLRPQHRKASPARRICPPGLRRPSSSRALPAPQPLWTC
jgi:hypothetical protein